MSIEQELSTLRSDPPPGFEPAVRLGTGIVDGFRRFESPIGDVIVTFNPAGVSSVDLADGDPIARFRMRFGRDAIDAEPPRGWDVKIGRAIERGNPDDLPVDLRSTTEFRRSVLRVTASIPRGQVRPYGWLAEQVGNAGAVRAVGSTMADNPVPLIIPCHRVVRSDGRIGNYSLGGPEHKTELLSREGIDLERLQQLAGRGIRFVASDTTGIFCLPTCSHARRIAAPHRVEVRTAREAEERGFRPCRVCQPA